MPHVLLDQAVRAGGTDHGFDGVTDIRETIAGPRLAEPRPHRLAGRLGETGDLVGHCADGNRDGGISVPSLDDGAAVDGQQIPVAQDGPVRNPMHHGAVHRRADHRRESVIAEEGRSRTVVRDDLTSDRIEVGRGHTGYRRLSQCLQRGRDDESRRTHERDLLR